MEVRKRIMKEMKKMISLREFDVKSFACSNILLGIKSVCALLSLHSSLRDTRNCRCTSASADSGLPYAVA